MSGEVKYDSTELVPFLLGAATEKETERMDELSVTDAEFSELLDAAEKDLFDAYSSGDLAPADRAGFEQRYLRSPLGRTKIRFAEALQEYASREVIVRTPEGFTEAEPPKKRGWFALGGSFLQWGFAAAAVLLAFIGGWLLFSNSWSQGSTDSAAVNNASSPNGTAEQQGMEDAHNFPTPQTEIANTNRSPEIAVAEPAAPVEKENQRGGQMGVNSRQTPPPPSGQRVLALVLSPQLRSGGQISSLSIPPNAGSVAARLQLEPTDFQSFRIILREQFTGRVVWQSGTIRTPRSARSLSANVPASSLKAGNYTFSVTGIVAGSTEIIGDYSFKVVR